MPDIQTLYDQHKQQVYRYSYGLLRDAHDAEDITAQTFETALKKIDRTEGYDEQAPWLLTIARQHILNKWRKKDFVTEAEQFPQSEEAGLDQLISHDQPTQLETLMTEEVQLKVRAALEKLPDAQREVIMLKHWEGMKLTEISRMTGDKLVTVKYRYYEGLKKLKTSLIAEEEGEEHLWGLYVFSLSYVYQCPEYTPAVALDERISSLTEKTTMAPLSSSAVSALITSKLAIFATAAVVTTSAAAGSYYALNTENKDQNSENQSSLLLSEALSESISVLVAARWEQVSWEWGGDSPVDAMDILIQYPETADWNQGQAEPYEHYSGILQIPGAVMTFSLEQPDTVASLKPYDIGNADGWSKLIDYGSQGERILRERSEQKKDGDVYTYTTVVGGYEACEIEFCHEIGQSFSSRVIPGRFFISVQLGSNLSADEELNVLQLTDEIVQRIEFVGKVTEWKDELIDLSFTDGAGNPAIRRIIMQVPPTASISNGVENPLFPWDSKTIRGEDYALTIEIAYSAYPVGLPSSHTSIGLGVDEEIFRYQDVNGLWKYVYQYQAEDCFAAGDPIPAPCATPGISQEAILFISCEAEDAQTCDQMVKTMNPIVIPLENEDSSTGLEAIFASTPEAWLQEYYQTLENGDYERAYNAWQLPENNFQSFTTEFTEAKRIDLWNLECSLAEINLLNHQYCTLVRQIHFPETEALSVELFELEPQQGNGLPSYEIIQRTTHDASLFRHEYNSSATQVAFQYPPIINSYPEAGCPTSYGDIAYLPLQVFEDPENNRIFLAPSYFYPRGQDCQREVVDLEKLGQYEDLGFPAELPHFTMNYYSVSNDQDILATLQTMHGSACQPGERYTQNVNTDIQDIRLTADRVDDGPNPDCLLNYQYVALFSPRAETLLTWNVGQEAIFTYDAPGVGNWYFDDTIKESVQLY